MRPRKGKCEPTRINRRDSNERPDGCSGYIGSTAPSERIAKKGKGAGAGCLKGSKSMIYEEFENMYKALVYPSSKTLNKYAYIDAREEYLAETRAVDDAFHGGLAKEYGLLGHPKERKVWELAWEEGHSSGYSTVEQYYDQFSELVRD
jgi:hypothetical protein